jgi:hypothetical protein
MTQGDRRPQAFERGQRLTAAALNSLVNAVVSILDRRRGPGTQQPLNMLGVLQSDLYAAVDWKSDPSTAVVRIARKNTAGNYELTTQEETVTNRFENISIDAGTLIGIEWIDGEWQPYKADCSPQSESIPGGSAVDSLLENQPPGGPSPP